MPATCSSIFSTPSGDRSASARPDPRRAFADNGGFWGRYEAFPAAGRIDFEAEEGVSPNVRGLAFSRSYELAGDRLIVTSTDEPQAQGDMRLTWQRVPTVEHLTPAYREVVGFWRHIEEATLEHGHGRGGQHAAASTERHRLYAGRLRRRPLPDARALALRRRNADRGGSAGGIRNYLGYYGALGVYPGEVFHNVLGGVQPSAGAILRRFAKITGDELVVTIPSGNPQSTLATTVHLRRLSGADDMLPRAR